MVQTSSTPPKRIVLLGATGSIGETTLRVIAAHRDKLQLVGIAACRNFPRLAQIARDFNVPHVAVFDDKAHDEARASDLFPVGTQLHGGLAGLTEIATLPEADLVLVAVVVKSPGKMPWTRQAPPAASIREPTRVARLKCAP